MGGFNLYNGDCREVIKSIADNSIDLIITDPPYFIDGIGEDWKTPQLKPQIEPMTLAQKPKEGTFVDNWLQYNVGLMNTKESLDGMFPGNIIEVSKKQRLDDEDFKVEHIIKLFTKEGQTVLDTFAGSGSHGVAALKCKKNFIGIEIEKKYYDICLKRLSNNNKHHNNIVNIDDDNQLPLFAI